jgi:hypothetical protein
MDAVLVGVVLPNVQNHSLAALAGAARARGFSVAFAPFSGFRDLEAVARRVCEAHPRVLGVSMQTTETALASVTLVDLVRARGYDGLVVAGGHFATLNANALLCEVPAIDAVVQFAGEAAFVALLAGGLDQPLAAIPGLLTRGPGGELRDGAPPLLDLAPRSYASDGDRDLSPGPPVHLGFGAADVVMSRGCEAHCGYCCVAGISDLAERHGQRHQRRSSDAIVDEIAALFHRRETRVFNFMDDNLLPMEPDAARAWIDEIAAGLAQRRVGRIALSMQLRADICTPEVVTALRELGLVRAYLGIDGFSGRQLVALGRRAPPDAAGDALAALNAAGIFTVCNALIIGPTFSFDTVRGEIDALARVRHAPVHLLPVDVRAGSAYFERVRRRGLLEGGTFCWRYRFADARTQLMAEALTGLPTRLEEYSVPVALYDLGYNLGIAQRLMPEARVEDARAIYAGVTARWNEDQIRVLRAAAAVAQDGDRAAIRRFIGEEQPRVRALDDELRALCASALRTVESAASRARGVPVRAHARGRLISAFAFSAALAACQRPLVESADATGSGGRPDAVAIDVGPDGTTACPDGRIIDDSDGGLDWPIGCGEVQAEVTFDANGVPTTVTLVDAGTMSDQALACVTSRLAQYCYPSYAGTTQTLISHHFWIA